MPALHSPIAIHKFSVLPYSHKIHENLTAEECPSPLEDLCDSAGRCLQDSGWTGCWRVSSPERQDRIPHLVSSRYLEVSLQGCRGRHEALGAGLCGLLGSETCKNTKGRGFQAHQRFLICVSRSWHFLSTRTPLQLCRL